MFLIIAIVVAAAICAMLGVKGLRFLGNLIMLVIGGLAAYMVWDSSQHPSPPQPEHPAWLQDFDRAARR